MSQPLKIGLSSQAQAELYSPRCFPCPDSQYGAHASVGPAFCLKGISYPPSIFQHPNQYPILFCELFINLYSCYTTSKSLAGVFTVTTGLTSHIRAFPVQIQAESARASRSVKAKPLTFVQHGFVTDNYVLHHSP